MKAREGVSRRATAVCVECKLRYMVGLEPAQIYSLDPEGDGRWICARCIRTLVNTAPDYRDRP